MKRVTDYFFNLFGLDYRGKYNVQKLIKTHIGVDKR